MRPPPTRPLTMETICSLIGANWMKSNSLRRNIFCVIAQSSPTPTEKPQIGVLLCPELAEKGKSWHVAVRVPVPAHVPRGWEYGLRDVRSGGHTVVCSSHCDADETIRQQISDDISGPGPYFRVVDKIQLLLALTAAWVFMAGKMRAIGVEGAVVFKFVYV